MSCITKLIVFLIQMALLVLLIRWGLDLRRDLAVLKAEREERHRRYPHLFGNKK